MPDYGNLIYGILFAEKKKEEKIKRMYKLSKVKQNLSPSFSENIGFVWRIKGFNYHPGSAKRATQADNWINETDGVILPKT